MTRWRVSVPVRLFPEKRRDSGEEREERAAEQEQPVAEIVSPRRPSAGPELGFDCPHCPPGFLGVPGRPSTALKRVSRRAYASFARRWRWVFAVGLIR